MIPQNIALLTDSCADLSPQLAADNHIYVLPLRILCADGEYLTVWISAAQISMNGFTGANCPRPLLPSTENLGEILKQIREDGYDGVIAVMLSSGLSGTYNLVRLAEEYADLPLCAFDSKSGSLGQGRRSCSLPATFKMAWAGRN